MCIIISAPSPVRCFSGPRCGGIMNILTGQLWVCVKIIRANTVTFGFVAYQIIFSTFLADSLRNLYSWIQIIELMIKIKANFPNKLCLVQNRKMLQGSLEIQKSSWHYTTELKNCPREKNPARDISRPQKRLFRPRICVWRISAFLSLFPLAAGPENCFWHVPLRGYF